MSVKPVVIFAGNGVWHVGAVGPGGPEFATAELTPDASPEQVAKAVAKMLSDAGYGGTGVLLALPSEWVLAARVDASELPQKARRQALVFKLEEELPVSAEEIVADFVGAEDRPLGLCVQTQAVWPFVQALEAEGIAVQSIVPAALLALGEVERQIGQASVVLWSEGERVNLITLADGHPAAWELLPPEPAGILRELKMMSAGKADRLQVWASVDPALEEQLRPAEELAQVTFTQVSMTDAAVRAAERVLGGLQAPPADFRRDAMAIADPLRQVRPAINAALVAAMLFFFVIAAAFYIRGSGYDELATRYLDEQQQLYREAFPSARLPSGPAKPLIESEYRRVRGQTSGASEALPTKSALHTLRDVMTSLAPDVRYQLDHAEFRDKDFRVTGTVRTYEDAGKLAGALRRAGGLAVHDPTTNRQSDGNWSFSISGTVLAEETPTRLAEGR